MARTNEESSTPIQDPAPAPSSSPPAVNRSMVSYGSARSVSSENRSIPASFQDLARNTDGAEDRQSVPTTDEYRAAFQQVMHQYEDLLSYVVSGRAKRMAEVSRQLERTNLVFMSVEPYPPANHPTILSLIEEQRNDISAKQKEIQVLDENVEGERSRLQSELVLALNTVPAPDLNQLVLEFGWPTVDVCQDLNLPYEYVLMARGTYNPTRIATSDNNEKIIVQEENDKITQLLQRISLLEDSLNRQTNGNASSTQRKSTKSAIDKSESGDALPIEAKRQLFGERRKRTKIPQFTGGNSEAAQQWLQRYEVLCEYLGFSEKEKAEELAAVLDGAALHWYIGLAHDDKRDWITLKQQFLRQHGGGANPAIAALAELKEIRQGNKSMRVFGPIITDLLQRAQIFSADVQLDYFKDRIHPELLKAIIYRGPTNLMDAINIATEVEQALLKSMGKSSNGNLSSFKWISQHEYGPAKLSATQQRQQPL